MTATGNAPSACGPLRCGLPLPPAHRSAKWGALRSAGTIRVPPTARGMAESSAVDETRTECVSQARPTSSTSVVQLRAGRRMERQDPHRTSGRSHAKMAGCGRRRIEIVGLQAILTSAGSFALGAGCRLAAQPWGG